MGERFPKGTGWDAEGKLGSAICGDAAGLSIPAVLEGTGSLCPLSLGLGSLLQKKKLEENRAMSGKQNSSFGAISIPHRHSVGFGEPWLLVPDIPLAEFSVEMLAGSSPGLVWGDGCSEVQGHYSSSPGSVWSLFLPLLGLSFFHGKSEEQEADC